MISVVWFFFSMRLITVVVGEGHHGGQVALAALGDDPEAGQGAPLAGDVEGRVAAVVGQPRVGAGLQEPLGQVRLLGDHCQVEGSLEGRRGDISSLTRFSIGSQGF